MESPVNSTCIPLTLTQICTRNPCPCVLYGLGQGGCSGAVGDRPDRREDEEEGRRRAQGLAGATTAGTAVMRVLLWPIPSWHDLPVSYIHGLTTRTSPPTSSFCACPCYRLVLTPRALVAWCGCCASTGSVRAPASSSGRPNPSGGPSGRWRVNMLRWAHHAKRTIHMCSYTHGLAGRHRMNAPIPGNVAGPQRHRPLPLCCCHGSCAGLCCQPVACRRCSSCM